MAQQGGAGVYNKGKRSFPGGHYLTPDQKENKMAVSLTLQNGRELVAHGRQLACQSFVLHDIIVYMPGSGQLYEKYSRHRKTGGT